MKKLFVCLLALTFVIGMGATSFAVEGELGSVSDSIDVTAEVGEYAEIIAGGLLDFNFDGSAGELEEANTSFTVESNCDIDLDFETTALSNDTDFINVEYTVDNDLIDPLVFTTFDNTNNSNINGAQGQNNGVITYNVDAAATLGEISDQAAGSYEALMTITVSSAN